jgi:hypothetical protein
MKVSLKKKEKQRGIWSRMKRTRKIPLPDLTLETRENENKLFSDEERYEVLLL